MAKRLSVRPGSISMQRKDSDLLDEIQRKISSSAALNGGFDTLLFKIDKIEQCQGQIVTKVDKIHDSIYDPSDGIFARISESKIENSHQHNEFSQKLAELSEWKKYKEKTESKHDATVDEASEKIASLEKTVDSLTKSRNVAWDVFKWLAVALAGGGVTLLFKWLEGKI
jgi:hypothetical protein